MTNIDTAALLLQEPPLPAPAPLVMLTTATALSERHAAYQEVRKVLDAFLMEDLVNGVDFGAFEGESKTGKKFQGKPTLLKPGAEKLCIFFGVQPRFVRDRPTLAMAGDPPGLFAYRCWLIDGAGQVWGEGRGASTLQEQSGNVNRAIKIAQKRAQVDAVLRAAGLSDRFTQDLEDQERENTPAQDEGRVYGRGEPAEQQPRAPRVVPNERGRVLAEIETLQGNLGSSRDYVTEQAEKVTPGGLNVMNLGQLEQFRDRMAAAWEIKQERARAPKQNGGQ